MGILPLVHHDARLVYWGVPKAAHSTINATLKRRGFIKVPREADLDGYTKFTVIREPVDRYWSGVWETYASGPAKALEPFEEYLAGVLAMNRGGELFDGDGDPHLAPQIVFLPDKPLIVFTVEGLAELFGWLHAQNLHDPDPETWHNMRPQHARDAVREMVTADDELFVASQYGADLMLHGLAMSGWHD